VLERFRAVLGSASDLNTAVPETIRVYVFKTKKDYARYGTQILGANPGKDALSIVASGAKVILVDGSALRADTLLRHELVHQFARQTWEPLPLWLDEGIADYYAASRFRENVVEVGLTRNLYRRVVMKFGPIPMRELLTAEQTSRWYTQSVLDARFYAQSWLLVHWIVTRRALDVDTVRREFATSSFDVAIANLFRMNPNQLSREITRYNALPVLPSKIVRIERLEIAAADEPRMMTSDEMQSMFAWTVR
jgi:hypothetical protein